MTKKPEVKLGLVKDDPWLEPYLPEIQARIDQYTRTRKRLEVEANSLPEFASAYRYLGFNVDPNEQGIWYREWAPAAEALSLIGDFDGWGDGLPMTRNKAGIWEVFIPEKHELRFEFIN